LYNHILASQNPQTAMMCYFVPLRMGTQKIFSDSFHTFTCCVGSGMENHSKYAEGIYYQGSNGNDLYVNLFIPSVLHWKEKALTIRQQTAYPDSNTIRFSIGAQAPRRFSLRIRKPAWAVNGYTIKVNGAAIKGDTDGDGFIVVERTWKNNDR